MNKIKKTFTYDIPDDYLYQTNDLKKTAQWEYNGPDRLWVFVNKDTNMLDPSIMLTDDNDGEICPTPLDKIKVMIDCNENPLLCTLVGGDDRVDYSKLPQYIEELPNGQEYQRPLDPPPDHTYDDQTIQYDIEKNEFVTPYPWKQPHASWDDIRIYRNNLLKHNDFSTPHDMPASLKQRWEDWRQELRDIPQTYGASDKSVIPLIDPWKVQPFPPAPNEQ